MAAALTAALLAYLVPIHSGSHVSWINPGSHRQWYKQAGLVFTGYAYPSLVIALFARDNQEGRILRRN